MEQVYLKVKKLHKDAQTPTRAHDNDSGFDVYAIDDGNIEISGKVGRIVTYKLGIAIEIPDGYEVQLRPRSSISTKTTLFQANGIGTIDAGYRGELAVIFRDTSAGRSGNWYKKGDRIGQLVVQKLPQVKLVEVEELTHSQRDNGGWGSTGD